MKGRNGNRKNGIEKETEKRIYIYMNEREGERVRWRLFSIFGNSRFFVIIT